MLTAEQLAHDFHVILPGGQVRSGERAVPEIVGWLPVVGPLVAFVLRRAPRLRARVYKELALRRKEVAAP